MRKNTKEANSPSNSNPSSPTQSNTNSNAPLRRRNAPFLIVCRCFSLITALSAILCIAVNILSAVRSFKHGSDVFDGIFRCYAVALAIIVVLAETEWSLIFKFWKVLEYWPGRSMLQIFVAVMTRAFSDFIGSNVIWFFFRA
ncbi:DNA ligase 1 [Bienertia sinuspersici]